MVTPLNNVAITPTTIQNNPATGEASTTQGVEQSGVAAQSGAVPDANSVTNPAALGAIALNLTAMLDSLEELMGDLNLSNEDLEVELASAQAKLKEMMSRTNVDQIKIQQEKKLAQIEAKKQKDEEAAQKIEDAIAAEKSASIWDKVKLAFQVLGAILATVIAVALIATGVGAAAGAALLIGAAAALVLAIDGIVKEASPDHLGIAGSIAYATGSSLEDAQTADMAFGISIAIVAAISAVVTFFINPVGTASEIASIVTNAAKIGEAVAEIGVATTTVGSAVKNYEATNDQADATELQSEATLLKAAMKQIDDSIDMAIKHLMGVLQSFDQKIDALVEAADDKAKTMQHAHIA